MEAEAEANYYWAESCELKVKTFIFYVPAYWGRPLKPQSFCGERSRYLVVFNCCLMSFASQQSKAFLRESCACEGLVPRHAEVSGSFWQSQTSSDFSRLWINFGLNCQSQIVKYYLDITREGAAWISVRCSAHASWGWIGKDDIGKWDVNGMMVPHPWFCQRGVFCLKYQTFEREN